MITDVGFLIGVRVGTGVLVGDFPGAIKRPAVLDGKVGVFGFSLCKI